MPRVGSFGNALVAFRAARLKACLSELHGADSIAAATLRARAFLRIGDPKAARSSLEATIGLDNRDRGEVGLLLAIADSRLGNPERARIGFRDAHVYGISSMDLALEAEVEFYNALTAFGENDTSEARAACARGLDVAMHAPGFTRSGGYVPIQHVISRIEELIGMIDAVEGRYRDAIERARASLSTLDGCGIADVYVEGFALRNLAIHARDFDIELDARMLRRRIASLEWTEEICRVEFTAVEALGWCSALRGDTTDALRLFRRAEHIASTTPERVLVGVDRALFAREFGHQPMVFEEVEYALEIAQGFDWENAAGDYRGALLTLAQAAAPIAPARAREMLDRHTALRNAMDVTFTARNEPRARAEEAYTQGLVFRAEGRRTVSMERLTTAFEIWAGIGFEWRAARAALELTELDAGDVFRLALRRELFQRPHSVFSARARLVA